MEKYDFKAVEKKWQDYWYTNKTFAAKEDKTKPKFYGLIEFPYPSGAGLHVGHIRAFTSIEVISRKRRLEGYSVLYPIGYDAFGLPTENYAMQTKQHPRVVTDNNIKKFEQQLKKIGYSFDWDRTVDTTDHDYYHWTQWIFLQMFKKGLAYKSKTYVNFCPKCKVVLANEESQNGICDRCGAEVEQKNKDVWFLKIRHYADRLLDGLKDVDFPERIKTEQENWIGKSTGAELVFPVVSKNKSYDLKCYTTRPDTIYGVTFLVIAPEHPMLEEFSGDIENIEEVREYQKQANNKKEFERIYMSKEKTGVMVKGITAKNRIAGTSVPVFIADYVMMDYGTGAIMAVPAHDTRDWEFAKKFNLPIIEVIKSDVDVNEQAFAAKEGGKMVNSPLINGLAVKDAIDKMISIMEKEGIGVKKTDFKMKDWAFNRQRYWGEPIPIINCPKCGQVPVPEKDLPVTLPDLKDFEPTDDATSPLNKLTDWVNVKCPVCGANAKRETDTMPQWAGSSWYFLRYMSPKFKGGVVDPEAYKYWGQVDWYNGGMEHVTRHLIYSRFWNMFLYDIGVVGFSEPYKRRSAQGLILGSDNEKMSKSRGNVVNPDDIINAKGADVLRLYILFIGDYEKPAPWNPDGIKGCERFLSRVWALTDMIKETDTSDINIDAHIKKVNDDYEAVKFNTAIAELMTFVNELYNRGSATLRELKTLLLLLNPVAPHITEELWQIVGLPGMLNQAKFPSYDSSKLILSTVEIPVQINGKVRGKIVADIDADEKEVIKLAKENDNIKLFLSGNIVKTIYVKGKILNLVVKA